MKAIDSYATATAAQPANLLPGNFKKIETETYSESLPGHCDPVPGHCAVVLGTGTSFVDPTLAAAAQNKPAPKTSKEARY
jgi:hypothetical protein